jgi:hypothetical protein
MEGAELAPFPAVPLLSSDTRSVLGWIANNTETVSVLPVLSVARNVTVVFPTADGVPVTAPVAEVSANPSGKGTPPNTAQVIGAVRFSVDSVEK